MNSIRCGKCSLVNFASTAACKNCGAPLDAAVGNETYTQSPSFETHQTQNNYGTSSGPDEHTNQCHLYAGAQTQPGQSKGRGVRVTLLALLCLVLLLSIPLYLRREGTNEFANPAWREIKPDDGSFSILMPGQPLKANVSQPTPEGNFPVNIYFLKTSGKTHFEMFWVDYPASLNVSEDMVLEKNLDVAAGRTHATILSRRSITLDGYPGVELEIKPPAGKGIDGDKWVMREYWVSPRVYTIMVTGPDSAEAAPARAKFLDSFKLLKSR